MAYKKGESGNLKGRPKVNEEFREACRDKTLEALETLTFWMAKRNKECASSSIKAAMAILEHAWGRAPQSIEHSTKDDSPLTAILRVGGEKPKPGNG